MAVATLIEGTIVSIGGTDYTVPPLNFSRAKKVLPLLLAMNASGDALDEAKLDAGTQLVHLALTRNYPELTIEQVEDMLDMRNFPLIVAAVMGASGIEKGEARPAAAAAP